MDATKWKKPEDIIVLFPSYEMSKNNYRYKVKTV